MTLTGLLGRWLGYADAAQIETWRASFGASWAHESPALVVFAIVAVAALAAWFYVRMQSLRTPRLRWMLAGLRGLILAALVLILADPILEITLVRYPQPVLWVGLDASDSMAVADELPSATRAELDLVTGISSPGDSAATAPTRADYVRAFLSADE